MMGTIVLSMLLCWMIVIGTLTLLPGHGDGAAADDGRAAAEVSGVRRLSAPPAMMTQEERAPEK